MSGSWRYRIESWIRRPPRPAVIASSGAVGDAHAAAVVDLALRTAELGVQTGALTSEATAFALTVGAAYGLEMDVDVTWTSIIISYQPSGRSEPITGFRGVRQRVNNYTVLTGLTRLVNRISKGELTVDEARAELDRVRTETPPYRHWVICLGQMLLGAGVAAILGGGPLEMLLAAIANALLYIVQVPLLRTQLSVFFIQAIGAAVPTVLGLVVMEIRSNFNSPLYPLFYQVSPSMIVASGIVSLLAGTGIVAAARDALDGNLITAGARTYDAIMQTTGIVIGVTVTLWLGLRLGIEGYIAPTTGWALPSAWQVLWASVIAVGVGLGFQLGMRALPHCAVLGAVGYAVYQFSMPLIGSWPGAIAVGAFTVGFLAQLASRKWQVPSIALVTTGIVSMMPGSMLYRGLFEAIRSIDGPLGPQAEIALTQVAMVGLALAAGSALGTQLARPLSMPTTWIARNALQASLWRSGQRPRTPDLPKPPQ